MSRPHTLSELEKVYETMNTKWIENPHTWKWTKDLESKQDTCLALYSYSDWKLQPSTWNRLTKWLEPLLSSGIRYSVHPQSGEGRLHFTLHQCTGFYEKHDIDKKTIEAAEKKLGDYFQQVNGIEIEFRGLLVTPTGITLRGFPKDDLQVLKLMSAREQLSTFLTSLRIPFEPPYINDICHATLFRWTKQPSDEQIQYIQNNICNWKETHIASFTPIEWCVGFGTLCMIQPFVKDILRIHTPVYIAHRGLTNGPDKVLENNLENLRQRCARGEYSECDIWYMDSKLYLGHDHPSIEICFDDICSPYLWLHAKNKEALEYLIRMRNHNGFDLCIFWHTTDDYTLTTTGDVIVYPGKDLIEGSTFMMPEQSNNINVKKNIYNICSDYINGLF